MIVQFSLHLEDTDGVKKIVRLLEVSAFGKLGNVRLIFENLLLLCLYLR